MPLTTPISVDFGPDADRDLDKYVWDNVNALKDGLRDLHESKVAKWRRLYRGVPKDETKNFPWKNASNLVVQLIGENVDIVKAFILGSIFEIMPLYVTGLVGTWKPEEAGAEQQNAVQEFMTLMGLEPQELDLYRVLSSVADEGVKFGTVMVKFPWITDVEAVAIGVDAQDSKKIQFSEFTKYDGPRPEKIEFERWAATPNAPTLEQAKFKYHEVILHKKELEERGFLGIYDKDAVKKIIEQPDEPGPDSKQQEKEDLTGAKEQQGYDNPEWHFYECWFPYFHNGKKYRIIYTYHLATKLRMRAIFNFYPKNEEPWEMGRLGYSDDGLYGYGYCEMLEHYQEEVSTSHNQRIDNRTLLNTSVIRVDPNSKLDANFSIYPNVLIPAQKDELEIMQLGAANAAAVDISSEQLVIHLAKARCGTEDPGVAGQGGSTTNKKGGLSAMATFSVMQSGNRRRNINVTDMRYLHLRMGRKLLHQYAEFGIGERSKYFGQRAKHLAMALQAIKAGRLNLPIRAATASINKELEKQNDMLLTQVMQRHHMGASQILQALANPQLPPEMKSFMMGWLDSASIVMDRILRNFGYDDTSRLLPERKLIEGASSNGQQTGGGSQETVSRPTGENQPVAQDSSSPQGGAVGMAGFGTM